jgi:hypothetical protein
VLEDTLSRKEEDRIRHSCPHNVSWFLKWQVPLLLASYRRWLSYNGRAYINPLMLELNPSAQRCLTRSFTGDFASLTVHFINICVKNQQIQQLFIQFINCVW